MKITTKRELTKINIVVKAYLITCVTLIKCLKVIREVVLWGGQKTKGINVGFVTMPALFLGIIYCISLILDTHNANIKATRGIEALATQDLFFKPFPRNFFEEIDVNCNRDNVVIDLKSGKETYSTKVYISNNSDYPLLLRNGGRYSFRVRPRFWDESRTKVVKDGMPIYLQTAGIALINSKDTLSTRLNIDVSELGNIPKDAKYLIFGIVQEGVLWAPTQGCKFEVTHG